MNAGMVGNAASHALEKKTMNDNEKTLNMQKFLNKHYNAGLAEDGMYGPKTREAVRKMQQELGITADGWWGTETQEAVAKAHNNVVPTVSNIRYNGKQKTSRQDFEFLYKNPGEGSSNVQTTTSASNNTDLGPQTNGESSAKNTPYGQRLSTRISTAPFTAFWHLLTTKPSEFNPGYGIRQPGNSSISFKKTGGKILMNFITK